MIVLLYEQLEFKVTDLWNAKGLAYSTGKYKIYHYLDKVSQSLSSVSFIYMSMHYFPCHHGIYVSSLAGSCVRCNIMKSSRKQRKFLLAVTAANHPPA